MAFTGEEEGLLGSAAYVKGLSKEQLLQIVAMVNTDPPATGPTKVEVVRGRCKGMLLALEAIAQTLHLPLSGGRRSSRRGEAIRTTFKTPACRASESTRSPRRRYPLLHTIRDRHLDQVKRWTITTIPTSCWPLTLAFLDEKLETTPGVSP